MFDFLKSIIPIITPIFVVATMLNVGLTHSIGEIIAHLKNYPFVLKMLAANFVLAPLAMVLMLKLAPFDPELKAGLLIFSLCAGAPILIKLTQTAQQNIALGAAVMMLLMVATVIYVPIVLPLILSGLTVDVWAVTRSLTTQMLLPIVVGMLAVQFLPDVSKMIQPWVGRLGNVTLFAMIGATLLGYLPNMIAIVGTGAILVGLAFVLIAFGIGYLTGAGKDHLEDVGGLGTAQRNTAAAVIIAVQDFSDYPNVMVIITLVNTLGIVLLMFIAKGLSRDNKVKVETV
jgi:bile acid:Na+ symporter, BASS family